MFPLSFLSLSSDASLEETGDSVMRSKSSLQWKTKNRDFTSRFSLDLRLSNATDMMVCVIGKVFHLGPAETQYRISMETSVLSALPRLRLSRELFPPSLLLTDEIVVILLVIFRFSAGSTASAGSTGSRNSDRFPDSGSGWSHHSSPELLLSFLILGVLFEDELR